MPGSKAPRDPLGWQLRTEEEIPNRTWYLGTLGKTPKPSAVEGKKQQFSTHFISFYLSALTGGPTCAVAEAGGASQRTIRDMSDDP